MTNLEIFAIVTNIISVALVVKNHKANWWVGLLGVVALFIFFWEKGLYGQCAVQVVFFVQSVHGYLSWSNKTSKILLPTKENIKWYDWSVLGLTGAVLSYMTLNHISMDYQICMLSMYTTYIMARRFIFHWIFWIMVDFLSIVMFSLLDMPGMVFLYGIFSVMCLFGLHQWSKDYEKQQKLINA